MLQARSVLSENDAVHLFCFTGQRTIFKLMIVRMVNQLYIHSLIDHTHQFVVPDANDPKLKASQFNASIESPNNAPTTLDARFTFSAGLTRHANVSFVILHHQLGFLLVLSAASAAHLPGPTVTP